MDPIAWTFVILALAVLAFVSGRIPLGVVAIGVALALWATGILTLGEALSGFGDPTVLFIASLFVVSESLDATGVTVWIGQQVIGRAGTKRDRLIVIIGGMVAVLTAFISINGAVAALLPVVVVVAVKAGIAPSRMLMPLAFAASAGSLLALTGTPVNIVVSDAALAAGGRAFGFFEFALAGAPLLVITVVYFAVFGGRLLPERTPVRLGEETPDPSEYARTLRASYEVPLETGRMFSVREGVAEVIISPRSVFIGKRVWPGMTTSAENLVILAIRHGETSVGNPGAGDASGSGGAGGVDATVTAANAAIGRTAGDVILSAGDSLLVQGQWASLERYVLSPDVIAVTSPRALQRAVPLGRGAKRALVILALMVVLLVSGVVPPVVAGLLAAGALVLTRVLSVPQTYRAISWTTVVLIAGMIPLSSAFISTGAADVVADGILSWVGDASPHLALLVLCTTALVLGQFISNVATVLILVPVAVSISQTLGLSIQPFMMALTVIGAASFLTPIATPVNMMVMQPAGYRFGDYWRPGLPLALLFLVVAVFYVPVIWPF